MAVAPALRPFDGTAIPQVLKDQPRWAPWVAVWNEKRQKYDKIPRRADVPEYGLSTANPDRWFTYAAALATFEREKPSLAGVGYVMTRPHGIVGVDLDNCLHGGKLDDWAQTVVTELASYTEVSPSGNGLRIFCQGDVGDWTNHTVGIEVYGGIEARFLTMTGAHLVGSPLDVCRAPAGVFEGLRAQYGRAAAVAVPVLDLPELVDDMLLPSLASLDLPYTARDFLESGDSRGDRSRDLHSAAVALYQRGLADDEVFSLLVASPHAMEVALDHRRQDSDRALVYLWKEHCLKAKSKGDRKVASADDFDDVSPADADKVDDVLDKVVKVSDKVVKGPRFPVLSVSQLLQRPRATWLIRNVLPQAELAIIYGESGSGKSFFTLDMVASLARGLDWRGHKVERAAPVVYICAEGEADFRDRVQAYCDFNGITDLPLGVIADAPNMMEKIDVRDLIASVRAFGKTSAIVVDTLAQTTAGADENSGQDMGRALAHCKALHRATGALVLLVHHTGKDASKGPRGWSGIRGAMDAMFEVEGLGETRSATVKKLKGGRHGAEFGFRLTSVEIGQHEDGEVISSCVVAHGAVERKKTAPKGDLQKIVLRAARAMLDLNDVVSVNELLENVVNEMPQDEGGTDRRRSRALTAITKMVEGGQISATGGRLGLPA